MANTIAVKPVPMAMKAALVARSRAAIAVSRPNFGIEDIGQHGSEWRVLGSDRPQP